MNEMILIPAGEFIMGSNQDKPDQSPEHVVFLKDYYIDKYPVTNTQYRQFIQEEGYKKREYWSDTGWEFINHELDPVSEPYCFRLDNFSAPTQPVSGISWYEAEAYARWAGKRLPTEAEWEKASRGTDRRKYPWGNEINFKNLSYKNVLGTLPVDAYPSGVSHYGVYDMAGNVWEWVADWYAEDSYKSGENQNPKGPTTGIYKVLRGGSILSNRNQLQTIYRYYDKPNVRLLTYGFRCAKDTQ